MAAKKSNVPETLGVWPTAWGPMGGVLGPKGLRRIILPHYAMGDLRDLLAWEHQGAAADDGAFESVAGLCREYFNGGRPDFRAVDCDLSVVGPFARVILSTCREIPFGQTRSYTQLALMAGEDGKQRAAAQALGANPIPLVIPCHRVTAAGGGLGGFSAAGGTDLKKRMLDFERSGGGS